jgi:hypothetical protein
MIKNRKKYYFRRFKIIGNVSNSLLKWGSSWSSQIIRTAITTLIIILSGHNQELSRKGDLFKEKRIIYPRFSSRMRLC